MIVYTIQEKKYFNRYLKNKTKPGEILCFEDFRPAYKWLNKQLSIKNKKFKQNKYHFWGWIKKPDLRNYKFRMPKNKSYYLISLNIPDESCILTDFQLWHFVLNGSYFYIKEKDYQQFSKKHNIDYHNYWNLPSNLKFKAMKKEIEDSWQIIFNIKMKKNEENIQVHFPEIKQNYLVSIKEFKGQGAST
jgi:hypothetical protein